MPMNLGGHVCWENQLQTIRFKLRGSSLPFIVMLRRRSYTICETTYREFEKSLWMTFFWQIAIMGTLEVFFVIARVISFYLENLSMST